MPPRAYQHRSASLSRIDTILGLYDQALEKTQRAADALAQGDAVGARIGSDTAKLAIGALVCTVAGNTDELSHNLLRLLEFVTHSLTQLQPEGLAAAQRVLATLRGSFEAIREPALRLERDGALPPLDRQHAVRALA
jgi:flagellin-specific chaperone FliS